MKSLIIGLVIAAVLIVILFGLAVRIVRQYEQGVVFRLGRLRGSRAPGLRLIIPFIDVMHKNTTVVFPAPLMSTIEELTAFLTREDKAAGSRNAPGVRQPNGATTPAIQG